MNRKAKAGLVPGEIAIGTAQNQVIQLQHLKFIGISPETGQGPPNEGRHSTFYGCK